MDIQILFEDDNIIICNKPAGIISEEGGLPDVLGKQLGCDIFCVHRLDKDVSGLMCYCKNKKAASLLSSQITDGTFKKEYMAIIHGIPEDGSGILEDYLFHDRKTNKTYVVKKERSGVKKAILEYTLLESFVYPGTSETVSKVHIILHTGRTHQIRAQFASRKMPVVGDRRYGSKIVLNKLELYSCRLTFLNPSTGKTVTFSLD